MIFFSIAASGHMLCTWSIVTTLLLALFCKSIQGWHLDVIQNGMRVCIRERERENLHMQQLSGTGSVGQRWGGHPLKVSEDTERPERMSERAEVAEGFFRGEGSIDCPIPVLDEAGRQPAFSFLF